MRRARLIKYNNKYKQTILLWIVVGYYGVYQQSIKKTVCYTNRVIFQVNISLWMYVSTLNYGTAESIRSSEHAGDEYFACVSK